MPIFNNILAGSGQGAAADLGNPIDQSLRFAPSSQSSGPFLHKTGFSNSGDVWTYSCWMKGWGPAGTTAQWNAVLFSWHNNTGSQTVDELAIFGNFPATNRHEINYYFQGAAAGSAYSNQEFNDPSAWYHVVWQSSSTSAVKLYVNNVEITNWRTTSSVTAQSFINKNQTCSIGARAPGSTSPGGSTFHGEGYLAAVYFIDGAAKSPSDFGKPNKDGVWVPKNYTGSYGTNGFHLTFDSSQDADPAVGIGIDSSGNNNHFTATGFDTADVALYSKDLTATGGFTSGNPATNAFDGTSSSAFTNNTAQQMVFAPSTNIPFTTSIQVLSGFANNTAAFGSNSAVALTAGVWTTIFTGSGTINASNTITVVSTNASNQTALSGIRVDGTTLIDNTDNDVDYKDTPTSNYAVLNSLFSAADHTPRYFGITKDANLAADTSGGEADWATTSNIELTDGKWYFEVTYTSNLNVGLSGGDNRVNNRAIITAQNGNYSTINSFGSNSASNSGSKTSGTIGCRVDITNRTLAFTWDGTTYTSNLSYDDPGHRIFPYVNVGAQQPTNTTLKINHGQMPFLYAVPAGFEGALQTNKLAEPTIKNGKDHFEALIYTGDGEPSKTITGLTFKPDLVWLKPRSVVDNHRIVDSVLEVGGGTLASNSTDGKSGQNVFSSLNAPGTNDSNGGFTLSGNDSGWNGNTSTYVAWCWKAGGAPTTDNSNGVVNGVGAAQTAGSVKVDGENGSFAQGSIAVKKMSVNTTAGFSIVEYQGTGNAGTIPHGLGAVPEFAIFKRHNGTSSWEIYHKKIGNTKAIQFTDAAEQSASSTYWDNTTPTSTLFHIGGGGNNNTLNEQVISYIWTPIEGYSKFDLYVGNGSADGPFIYTGFRPAFVLTKRKDNSFGGEWSLFDTARNTTNPADLLLSPDTTSDDRTGQAVDFLSNGFKIRKAGDWYNQLNGQYIYAAFAENPFGGENAPPATAR